jgi:hypothetical protein
MKASRTTCFFGVLLAACLVVSWGLGSSSLRTAEASETEASPCVAEGQLERQIAGEAEVEAFACTFKRWEGSVTLHFKVALKNVSDQPQRFRVNIFLDNGKAVGGLIPRKTGKGLLEPQQTADFEYPVGNMPQKPESVLLVIETVSQ